MRYEYDVTRRAAARRRNRPTSARRAIVLLATLLLFAPGCMRERYRVAMLQAEARRYQLELNRASYALDACREDLISCRERNEALRSALEASRGGMGPISPGDSPVGIPGSAGAPSGLELSPEVIELDGGAPIEFGIGAPPTGGAQPETDLPSSSPSDAPSWGPEPSLPLPNYPSGAGPGYDPSYDAAPSGDIPQETPRPLPDAGPEVRQPAGQYRTDSTASRAVVPASHEDSDGWAPAPHAAHLDVRKARRMESAAEVADEDALTPPHVSDLFNEATDIPESLQSEPEPDGPLAAPEWSPEASAP